MKQGGRPSAAPRLQLWYVAAGDFGGRIVDAGLPALSMEGGLTGARESLGGMGLAGAGLAVGLLVSVGSAGFIAKLLQDAVQEGEAADAAAAAERGQEGGGGGAGAGGGGINGSNGAGRGR